MIPVQKKPNYLLLLCVIAVPVLIYFYFVEWKTTTMYGDDLYLFRAHAEINGVLDKIDMPSQFGKFRPVHGMSLHLIIEWFQKNLDNYYLFNVGIQTLNTFIFALLVNLFLRSAFLSILLSLVVGLSRFSFFNMTQLLNGGALEGLALTFFLASLYFITRSLYCDRYIEAQKQKGIIWGIIFANLSMYAHERYLVIFPFIVIILFLSPALQALTRKRRFALALLAIGSIVLNVVIKKYLYSLPFLMGTASTGIEFSFATAFSFLGDALLSIFLINSGPEFLTGVQFSSLSVFKQVLILAVFVSFLVLLVFYVAKVYRAYKCHQRKTISEFYIFLFLLALFVLLLIPSVSTIRLEQRWLQASFCIFILMCVIALSNLEFKSKYLRAVVFCTFSISIMWANYTYLSKGANNIYMVYSEKIADGFKDAINSLIIRPATKRVYVWEKQNDTNNDNAIKWSLGNGYVFNFYEGGTKDLVFVDSLYEKAGKTSDSSFTKFDNNKEQIIYIHYRNNGFEVFDISKYYLRDSLKYFNPADLDELKKTAIQYPQDHLVITNADSEDFLMEGFYDNENGASWTNGNVSIGFKGDFNVRDSLRVELNTYMPPICKSVSPRIFITDFNNKEYYPVASERTGDAFLSKFYFEHPVLIQNVRIVSETIKATPPDTRVLSFPFISLDIKNVSAKNQ